MAESRSGFTNLYGKLSDEPINGLKLPIEVLERLREEAGVVGLPFHEFLREVLTLRVFPREEVERAFAKRLDAIEGKVKEG